jgi:hypothetical protein
MIILVAAIVVLRINYLGVIKLEAGIQNLQPQTDIWSFYPMNTIESDVTSKVENSKYHKYLIDNAKIEVLTDFIIVKKYRIYINSNTSMSELEDVRSKLSADIKTLKIRTPEDVAAYVMSISTYKTGKSSYASPVSLVKNGEGNCEAYTIVTGMMLDMLNIDNRIASGTLTARKSKHIWNEVRSPEGEWLELDVTMADSVEPMLSKLFIMVKASSLDDREWTPVKDLSGIRIR